MARLSDMRETVTILRGDFRGQEDCGELIWGTDDVAATIRASVIPVDMIEDDVGGSLVSADYYRIECQAHSELYADRRLGWESRVLTITSIQPQGPRRDRVVIQARTSATIGSVA